MQAEFKHQIVISGVGGQGVLFITRLLAEAAILKGLPVFTSETHGMAQRGGTVISHLKVGDFAGPLILPGDAGGLIALKAESLDQHGGYLKPGAWATVNASAPLDHQAPISIHRCDADHLARKMDNPRSLNLIMLGFTLANCQEGEKDRSHLYCALDDIIRVLESRLRHKKDLLKVSLKALFIGAQAGQ